MTPTSNLPVSSQSPVLPVETRWVLAEQGCSCNPVQKSLARVPGIRQLMLVLRICRDTLSLIRQYIYDFNRVVRYTSAIITGNSREKLAALITMAYHSIEKGLALPNPRPGFGQEQVKLLISRLERYGGAFGFDDNAIVACNALSDYFRFCEKHNVLNRALQQKALALQRYIAPAHTASIAGAVRLVTRVEFFKNAKVDLTGFFKSRASVRQYARQPVDVKLIEAAVEMARRTPSCCNRQAGRLWVINDPAKVQRALKIQGGARGFSDEVPMVLVVTSNLACFQSSGERYQHWIDGGMFAMSVIYGLHSLGLVTCCLNWSKSSVTDQEFHKEFPIPNNESIIMLISVGHPKEYYSVAQSTRKPVSEIMSIVS